MGVDVVMRQHGGRPVRLPPRARGWAARTTWSSGSGTATGRPWMSREEFAALPRVLAMRELRVRVEQPGFRTRSFVVVTSLLDPAAFPAGELAALYRQRWHAELDMRSIKQTMRMDVLRCKTPAMVRKEFWAHLLAYNLIRGVMAEAARRHGVPPRRLSFQGARQMLEAFRGELGRAAPGRPRRCWSRRRWGRSRSIGWGTGPTGWSRGWSSGGPRRTRGCRCRGRLARKRLMRVA